MKEIINLIRPDDLVKVKVVRNQVVLHNVNTCNKKATIKKISGKRHINLNTGEIVEENQIVKRGESLRSLLESNIKLQDLIKENTIDCKKMLLVTLTYAQKTLDTIQINKDFKEFMRKLRRNITQFGKIEYINALELHADKKGYHIHAILFLNESTCPVFIPIATLQNAWQMGSVAVGKPKQNKDVYFYLTPHLANEVTDKNSKMHNKALLQMELPAGQNLYRYSKGIKKPTVYTDTYESVQKYLKESSCILERQQIYKNPMKTYRGNNLYYCKETYTREIISEPTPHKRTPI